MKKIYLTLLVVLTVFTLKASPDIYAPDLAAPADAATGINPNILLDWSPVTGLLGLYYEVNLDTTADFTNPAVFTTDLSSYKTSLLLFGTQYHWRVRAVDNSGTSDWSAVRSFTVIDAVVVKNPTDNAPSVAANVQIKWQDVSGAEFIDYEIDSTTNFNSPLLVQTTVVSSSSATTNASALHFGQKYYLRMRARHSADTSNWSIVRNFTVTSTFTLKNPADNATGLSPDVSFEWTKVEEILKYQIHLSATADMEQYDAYNVPATTTKITPDTLQFGTQYFWRLAAIHANDTLFSAIRNLTTVVKPTLTAPSNNATNVVLQPVLTWQALTGLVSFELDLAHNTDFTDAFKYTINSGGDNTFKVPIHVLDSATVYYWRVRAISSRDTSEYSDTWNFRSVALGVEEGAQLRNSVKVYPTPATSKVNITIRSTFNGTATIEIYDLLGNRKIATTANFTNGFSKDFPVGNLSNGLYMLSIISEGQRSTSKLIIQK